MTRSPSRKSRCPGTRMRGTVAGRDSRTARRAPRGPPRSVREEEALLRPGDPDVGEPALLLQLARVVPIALGGQRPRVREDALLQAADEDGPELQALRSM